MTPYDRLKIACEQNGTTVTNFCSEIKKSKGNLSTWKKGNFSASDLKEIHERLGVSADWLLFGRERTEYEKLRDRLPDESCFVRIVGICSNPPPESSPEFYSELVEYLEEKGINVTEISKLDENK